MNNITCIAYFNYIFICENFIEFSIFFVIQRPDMGATCIITLAVVESTSVLTYPFDCLSVLFPGNHLGVFPKLSIEKTKFASLSLSLSLSLSFY